MRKKNEKFTDYYDGGSSPFRLQYNGWICPIRLGIELLR